MLLCYSTDDTVILMYSDISEFSLYSPFLVFVHKGEISDEAVTQSTGDCADLFYFYLPIYAVHKNTTCTYI